MLAEQVHSQLKRGHQHWRREHQEEYHGPHRIRNYTSIENPTKTTMPLLETTRVVLSNNTVAMIFEAGMLVNKKEVIFPKRFLDETVLVWID